MKNHLHLVFLIIICVSCYTPKKAIDSFSYCFENKNTQLKKLINIEGFYYLPNKIDSLKSYPEKTEALSYLFYENGFFEERLGPVWLEKKDFKYGNFGLYKIKNDTIKTQLITSPDAQVKIKYSVWFKIVNKSKLEIIYIGSKDKISKVDLEKFKNNSYYSKKKGTTFIFHPLDEKPDINKTYIINKKWFWCNLEDFNNWKKSK